MVDSFSVVFLSVKTSPGSRFCFGEDVTRFLLLLRWKTSPGFCFCF
jgi:hypothetical protein